MKTNEENFLDFDTLHESFEVAYQALVDEKPVTCAHTSEEFASVTSPDAAILDVRDVICELELIGSRRRRSLPMS